MWGYSGRHIAHKQAYSEDLEALEWIMDVVRNDEDPHIELSFATDKPGLMARRIMYRISKKEHSEPAQSPALPNG